MNTAPYIITAFKTVKCLEKFEKYDSNVFRFLFVSLNCLYASISVHDLSVILQFQGISTCNGQYLIFGYRLSELFYPEISAQDPQMPSGYFFARQNNFIKGYLIFLVRVCILKTYQLP